MLLGVVVHEVNTLAHPSIPPGWRWAVHTGDNWSDVSTCLNAGWEPSQNQALLSGEAAAVVGAKIARILGETSEVRSWVIDRDPIRAGGDLITVGS